MTEFSLVTGAGGKLGGVFCEKLCNRGDRLILTGRDITRLTEVKQKLLGIRGDAEILVFPMDLTDEKSRAKFYEFMDENQVSVKTLINVAGVDTQLPFLAYNEKKIIYQIRVNLEGTVALTSACLNRRAENMKILTVSSMSGACPMPYFAIYSATKSALSSFFFSLRSELKGEGVSVTVLMPGSVPTRDDIIEDIKKQGIYGKLSTVSMEKVAKKALFALDRNKRLVIPGAFNKFVYALTRITPQKLSAKFIAKRWAKKTKDAFPV